MIFFEGDIRGIVFDGFRAELSQQILNNNIGSFLNDKFKVGPTE